MKALREPKWHGGKSLWWLRIGKKHSRAGQPVEAAFYWPGDHNGGKCPTGIVAEAVAKQREFEWIKADWSRIRPRLEAAYIGAADQRPDWSEPVWFDRERLESAERSIAGFGRRFDEHVRRQVEEQFVAQSRERPQDYAQIITKLISAGVIPQSLIPPRPETLITLKEAMDAFIDHERSRIALEMRRRIGAGTFNGLRNNLYLVVGLPTARTKAAKVQRRVIDTSLMLVDLNRNKIRAVIDYWFTMPEGVGSVRTVKNYLSAFKTCLNWCDKQTAFGWTKPKDFDDLFKISDVAETQVMAYDPDLYRKVTSKGGGRLKMYGLFALLLGYYPKDIATIREGEFFEERGEWFVKRARSKEKSGKKSGRIIRTKRWVTPELVGLIQKHRIPGHPHGLLLLNKLGLPMFREEAGGVKTSAAQKAWDTAARRAAVSLPIKQLRRWGWNAIKRITASVEMANRWAGQVAGIDKHYDDAIYDPVIAAQKQWAQELRVSAIPTPDAEG